METKPTDKLGRAAVRAAEDPFELGTHKVQGRQRLDRGRHCPHRPPLHSGGDAPAQSRCRKHVPLVYCCCCSACIDNIATDKLHAPSSTMSSDKGNRLFDSSDESSDEEEKTDELNVENNYAKNYNDWRRKEELQKLKDKYGDNLDIMSEIEGDSASGSGSEEDEESDEESDSDSDSLSDDLFDEQFLKVYSALKSKDPEIYDKTFNVANHEEEEDSFVAESNKSKDDKRKKLTLQEYHKKLIKEKKGITEEDELMISDQANIEAESKPNGYYEELYNIRKEIKDIVKENNEEDDESDDDEFFSIKGNTSGPKPLTRNNSKSSKGEKNEIITKIWDNNKQLDKSDEFLKDYIINKRYQNESSQSTHQQLNKVENRFGGFENNENDKDDSSSEDEQKEEIEQSQFEIAKYHYEEPDASVIKRYPRAVGSVRDTVNNDKKSHRAEVREKKKKEKESELKRLRKLKREETESKIQRLKKISDNQSIDIKDLDLNVIIDDENEFDLEKYDQKMQLLFGDSYYNNTGEDGSKPTFDYVPEIDDDLYGDEVECSDKSCHLSYSFILSFIYLDRPAESEGKQEKK